MFMDGVDQPPNKLLSKLVVSHLVTPTVVSYIIPYIVPFKEFRLQLICWRLLVRPSSVGLRAKTGLLLRNLNEVAIVQVR